MRSNLLLLALFSVSSSQCIAQDRQQPTDIDLHTAYCIPVVKAQILLTQQGLASAQSAQILSQQLAEEGQKSIAKLQAVLNRLQLSFALKLLSVDAIGLAVAAKRGEADYQDFSQMSNRCAVQDGVPQDSQHYDACMDQDLIARMKACDTPTWLPF